MLTKSQKKIIENLARQTGTINLYRETSLSGKSETLRWQRRWVEAGRWGPTPRTRSGMILSVKIGLLDDGSDDPRDLEKYEAACQAAIGYYELLKERDS